VSGPEASTPLCPRVLLFFPYPHGCWLPFPPDGNHIPV
jgi:hypothetical protein